MQQDASARSRTLTIRIPMTPQQAQHLAQYLQRTARQAAPAEERSVMQHVTDQVSRALVNAGCRPAAAPRTGFSSWR